MEGLRTALVAIHAWSLAQPPMRPSGERPKPRQVTVVAEGVDIVEQRRETSPVMSPVTAGAGAGAKLSEKLSTVASAAFGKTSRMIFCLCGSRCSGLCGFFVCEKTAKNLSHISLESDAHARKKGARQHLSRRHGG